MLGVVSHGLEGVREVQGVDRLPGVRRGEGEEKVVIEEAGSGTLPSSYQFTFSLDQGERIGLSEDVVVMHFSIEPTDHLEPVRCDLEELSDVDERKSESGTRSTERSCDPIEPVFGEVHHCPMVKVDKGADRILETFG